MITKTKLHGMAPNKFQGGAAVNAILSKYAGQTLSFKELLELLRTNGALAAALRKAVAARPTPAAPAVLPKAQQQLQPLPAAPACPAPPTQSAPAPIAPEQPEQPAQEKPAAPSQWSDVGGKFGAGKWG